MFLKLRMEQKCRVKRDSEFLCISVLKGRRPAIQIIKANEQEREGINRKWGWGLPQTSLLSRCCHTRGVGSCLDGGRPWAPEATLLSRERHQCSKGPVSSRLDFTITQGLMSTIAACFQRPSAIRWSDGGIPRVCLQHRQRVDVLDPG